MPDVMRVLDVILVSLALAVVGALLPRLFEKQKIGRMEATSLGLICRETEEMSPREPPGNGSQEPWPAFLQKRFIHEEIFRRPSENCDFILTLDPDLAYSEAQLWVQYDKAQGLARKATKGETRADAQQKRPGERGIEWCWFLKQVSASLERTAKYAADKDIVAKWEEVVRRLHPDVWAAASAKSKGVRSPND